MEVDAEQKGQGAFTRFLDELIARFDGPIGIDTVVNEQLARHLIRRGAVRVRGGSSRAGGYHWCDLILYKRKG